MHRLGTRHGAIIQRKSAQSEPPACSLARITELLIVTCERRQSRLVSATYGDARGTENGSAGRRRRCPARVEALVLEGPRHGRGRDSALVRGEPRVRLVERQQGHAPD